MDKNKYDIQIALAGYNKKDIDINLEEGVLTIESKKDEKKETKIDSELKDGLLRVSLERIVPEHKKARTISIK